MFTLSKSLGINISWNNSDHSSRASWQALHQSTSPHCSRVTLFLSWQKNSISSTLFDGLSPSIFLFITFQRFIMGFRSGVWAGHDRVLIWWPFIHTFINLAVWHGILFCWKKQSSDLGNIIKAEGSMFSYKIT